MSSGESITIPLVGGQDQGVDPKLMPMGRFARLENVRQHKDGRLQIRRGLIHMPSISSVSGDKMAHTFAVHRDSLVVVGAAHPYVRQDALTAEWNGPTHRISSFLPDTQEDIDPTPRAATNILRVDQRTYETVTMIAWDMDDSVNTTTLNVVVRDSTTGAIILWETFSGLSKPRIVRTNQSGTKKIHVVYRKHSDDTIRARNYNLSGASATLSAESAALATMHAGAGAQRAFDACDEDESSTPGDEFYVVWQNNATQLGVMSRDGSYAFVNSVAVTGGFAANPSMAFSITTTSTHVWTAWNEWTSPLFRVTTHPKDLSATTGPTTLFNSGNFSEVAPAIIVDSASGKLWVFCQLDINSTGDRSQLLGRSVTTAHVLDQGQQIAEGAIGSKPIKIGGEYFILVYSARPGTLTQQALLVRLQSPDVVSAAGSEAWSGDEVLFTQLDAVCPIGASDFLARRHLSNIAELPSPDGLGTRFMLAVTIKRELAAGQDRNGLRWYTFRHHSHSFRHGNRRPITVGNSLIFPGGVPCSFSGVQCAELGWIQPPKVGAVASAGGGMTASATYQYLVTIERRDADGNLHVSAPVGPIIVNTGVGEGTVTLSIYISPHTKVGRQALVPESEDKLTLRIFRTQANGQIFNLRTSSTQSPGYIGVPLSVVDASADGSISSNPFVYTQQFGLAAAPPPAARYAVVAANRLWLGGLFVDGVGQASKLLIPNIAPELPNNDAFRVIIPGKHTSIAELDGAVIYFTRDEIYVTGGPGPDDNGLNGTFNEPVRIPNAYGSIDHRATLTTPVGVIFQSARGMELLPRGFGTPVYIGRQVADLLQTYPYVTSAVLVAQADELTARFTLSSSDVGSVLAEDPPGVILIYDLRTNQWSVDIFQVSAGGSLVRAAFHAATVWNGLYTASRHKISDGMVLESTTVFGDVDAVDPITVPMLVETGDIRPFGTEGHGKIRELIFLGEARSPSATVNLQAELSIDSGINWVAAPLWQVSPGVTLGARLSKSWGLPVQHCDEMRFRFTATNGLGGQGLFMNAITLARMTKFPGTRRSDIGDRVGG